MYVAVDYDTPEHADIADCTRTQAGVTVIIVPASEAVILNSYISAAHFAATAMRPCALVMGIGSRMCECGQATHVVAVYYNLFSRDQVFQAHSQVITLYEDLLQGTQRLALSLLTVPLS